jgi:MFS transporter, DHA1 family, inner membrane transport protein
MPLAVYALTAGAFGIGTTEFVIMGLLLQVAGDFGVSVSAAGLLISGYALGVVAGAPILTLATRRMPRKTVLLALMLIFTIGNLACALAPNYEALMAARIVTALAHGTFFGVGSVVATSLVAPDRKASAIAVMFTGLTVATLLGVPFGAWLGLAFGWRAVFFAVTAIGVAALIVLGVFVPRATAIEAPIPLRQEIAAILKPQVQLGFLMTVLGFAGVFTVFTYIQPILVQVTGFSEAAVAPILLVFGLGLIGGNLLGGRLADRNLVTALIGTLAALLVVLVGIHSAIDSKIAAIVAIGLLGAAAFATVAPLQLRVLEKAGPAGQNFASSLNIAAFNLGNAIGAWLGGVTLDHGFGLGGIPMSAAAITALGVLTALWSVRLDRNEKLAAVAAPAE